jgi:hypothetical protein
LHPAVPICRSYGAEDYFFGSFSRGWHPGLPIGRPSGALRREDRGPWDWVSALRYVGLSRVSGLNDVAHGLARIGTDYWVTCSGLCFLAIELSSCLAISLSSHKMKSAVPADCMRIFTEGRRRPGAGGRGL